MFAIQAGPNSPGVAYVELQGKAGELEWVGREIKRLKEEENADTVIVIPHWYVVSLDIRS